MGGLRCKTCSCQVEGSHHSPPAVTVDGVGAGSGLRTADNRPWEGRKAVGWKACGSEEEARLRGREVGTIAVVERMVQRCWAVGRLDCRYLENLPTAYLGPSAYQGCRISGGHSLAAVHLRHTHMLPESVAHTVVPTEPLTTPAAPHNLVALL
jgi:hypothetical protein